MAFWKLRCFQNRAPDQNEKNGITLDRSSIGAAANQYSKKNQIKSLELQKTQLKELYQFRPKLMTNGRTKPAITNCDVQPPSKCVNFQTGKTSLYKTRQMSPASDEVNDGHPPVNLQVTHQRQPNLPVENKHPVCHDTEVSPKYKIAQRCPRALALCQGTKGNVQKENGSLFITTITVPSAEQKAASPCLLFDKTLFNAQNGIRAFSVHTYPCLMMSAIQETPYIPIQIYLNAYGAE